MPNKRLIKEILIGLPFLSRMGAMAAEHVTTKEQAKSDFQCVLGSTR